VVEAPRHPPPAGRYGYREAYDPYQERYVSAEERYAPASARPPVDYEGYDARGAGYDGYDGYEADLRSRAAPAPPGVGAEGYCDYRDAQGPGVEERGYGGYR
jgi:hypothetical protein